MSDLTEADLRSLRAYRDAKTPIAIEADKRMFMRLYQKQLVIGSVSYDERGDPVGVIRLTGRGRQALGEAEQAA